MKKFFLLWLFALLLGHFAYSQTVTAIDMETQQPISAVSFITRNPDLFVETDENGSADLSGFKNAKSIEIRKLGYEVLVMSYSDMAASNFKIQIQTNNLEMEELVITASRWKQSSANVPSKVIHISTEDIELYNPQTAADMLSISGKVFIQKSQQGGGSPMIRGFATNRLLYAVDGVRMNTAIFRSGNIQNVINIDPYALETSEVLFGPGSVMYGSDAIGGVMSFQTIQPELSLTESTVTKGKFALRHSTANNERTAHFDVNVGWKKWAFVTSLSSWDYDHLRQGSVGPEDYVKPYYVQRIDGMDKVIEQKDPLMQIESAYRQFNMMQKIRFMPSNSLNITYAFHYSETSPYGRYDRQNRIKDNMPRYAEWEYGPQKWYMNHLNVQFKRNTLVFDEVNINLAVQNFEESRISRNFNAPIRENRLEKVDAYSANLDFKKSINERNDIFYGGEYVMNDVNSRGFDEDVDNNTSIVGPSRYPNSKWQSLALYISDSYKLTEKVDLQAGMRYTNFNLNSDFDTTFYPFPFTKAEIKNNSVTGSAGFVYHPNKKWTIRSSFGTAFRSPNVDDIGKVFDSEPGAVVIPNPDLEAEYAQNIDFGVAKIFGEDVRLDLTFYYTKLNNAFVRRDFTLNGQDSVYYDGELSKVQAMQNAAQTTVYGIQAGLEIKLPSGFSFSLDVNYQEGKEELDDGTESSARHAAPFFGSARLNYRYNQLRLQLYSNFQAAYSHVQLPVSEQSKVEIYALDKNGKTYAPQWSTLNFKALYELFRKFDVSVGVENITDQRYRPFSSGISAPGRNFIFAAIYKF